MSTQNLSGQTLGQYELRELLGEGGMGAVYRGYQAALKRYVAVKVLAAQFVEEPGALERFNREAETSAALEHPHIIHIYDYGTQRGISFLVMQLLTGGSLVDRLKQRAGTEKPLPSLGEVSDLLSQLASALDYAHSQGVIHRDIKPSNVMFDNHGQAYLVDFGIAKLMQGTTGLTASGMVMGTWAFMAPEQWKSEAITPATDQYALAVMTYALITGQMPFDAPTPAGIMHKHLNETPTPPHTRRADIPEAVTQVIERALAKKPVDRFPTVTAFAQAFDRAIRGQIGETTHFFSAPIASRKTAATVIGTLPHSAIPTPPVYKHPALWGMVAVMIALVGVIAILVLGGQHKTEKSGATAVTPLVSDIPREEILVISTLSATETALPPTPTASPVIPVSPSITATVLPTASYTLPPADTPDLNATAQALVALMYTQTAESWTDTPVFSETPTQDLIALAETRVIAGLTATAQGWTDTPSPTATLTLASTLPPPPTSTTAPSWTPTILTATSIPPTRIVMPSSTPLPYLHVGGTARVYVEDEGLKLRSGAGINYPILENLPKDTVVTLIGEPVLVQGYRWWNIRSPYGTEGWSVESADNMQTLIALPD